MDIPAKQTPRAPQKHPMREATDHLILLRHQYLIQSNKSNKNLSILFYLFLHLAPTLENPKLGERSRRAKGGNYEGAITVLSASWGKPVLSGHSQA